MCVCSIVPEAAPVETGIAPESGTTSSAVTPQESRYLVAPWKWDTLTLPDRDLQVEHVKTALQIIAALITVGAFIYSLLKK